MVIFAIGLMGSVRQNGWAEASQAGGVVPAPAQPDHSTPGHPIALDVVVADKSGSLVPGLEKKDFTLLIDGKPEKEFTVEAVDGAAHKDVQPAEAIIVLDAVNERHQDVEYTRQQVAKFLRQNGGHLAVPTSVFLLTDAGVQVQPRPTTDGNSLAAYVDKLELPWRYIDRRGGGAGVVEEFQLSLRLFMGIVESEAKKPNRKLLIWMGSGWPMLNGTVFRSTSKAQQEYFTSIVELSRKMREGRMALYSISGDLTLYKEYLNSVKAPREADAGNLSLKVLMTQSGGDVVSSGTNLVDAINRILPEAHAYYRLRFEGAPAEHANEYHELKVIVEQPGVTARTRTCYYAQP